MLSQASLFIYMGRLRLRRHLKGDPSGEEIVFAVADEYLLCTEHEYTLEHACQQRAEVGCVEMFSSCQDGKRKNECCVESDGMAEGIANTPKFPSSKWQKNPHPHAGG